MNRQPKDTCRRFLERTFIGRALARLLTILLVLQMLVANQAHLLAAGPVVTAVAIGSTVQLNGAASSDADRNPLTYRWSLIKRPPGSAAALSNPTIVNPTFVADRAGTYVAQLIVSDGSEDSYPDTVTITAVLGQISVPNVVGVAQAAAEAAITAAALVVGTITKANSATVAAGNVISQAPAAGASAQLGSAVNLTVSLGPPQVAVPNVVGQPQAQAQTAIVAAKLAVGSVTKTTSATVPAGNIVSQTPVAGASAPTGSVVNLTVSLGPPLVTVPNVVGQPQAQAQSALVAAKLAVGTITTAINATVPAGSVISQSPAAGASAPPASAVNLTVSVGPLAPTLIISSLTPAAVQPHDWGQSVAYTITVQDGSGTPLAGALVIGNDGLTVATFTTAATNAFGQTTYTTTVPSGKANGTYNLTFAASKAGFTTSATITRQVQITHVVPTTPPVAMITAPLDSADITAPTTITGTASSPALASYVLQYRLREEQPGPWVTFATGSTSVQNGPLGIFDPTLLLNGIYEIQLITTDSISQSAVAMVPVIVRGDMKVGNFSVAFTDLQIPVSGLPISVVRTYDSRDKRKGDFGVGWRLDVGSVRVAKASPLGAEGWQITRGTFNQPQYCIGETKPHFVTVTFPGGRVEKFRAVLYLAGTEQSCRLTAIDSETPLSMAFVAEPGSRGKLAIQGNVSLAALSNGGDYPISVRIVLGSDPELGPFDAGLNEFTYTSQDGRQFYFDDAGQPHSGYGSCREYPRVHA